MLLFLIIDALLLQHNSQNEDVGMSVCCCCYHNLGKDCLQLNVRYPLYICINYDNNNIYAIKQIKNIQLCQNTKTSPIPIAHVYIANNTRILNCHGLTQTPP